MNGTAQAMDSFNILNQKLEQPHPSISTKIIPTAATNDGKETIANFKQENANSTTNKTAKQPSKLTSQRYVSIVTKK